jgi:hypothetical protein
MTTHVDVEEIQTTKSEKLLAAVLVVFLLIGGLWTYQRIDDWVSDRIALPTEAVYRSPAVLRQVAAQRRLGEATSAEGAARSRLELDREAFRTALEADEPAAALRARYHASQASLARATKERAAAERVAEAAEPAAKLAREEAAKRLERAERRRARWTFGLRLLFVLAAVGAATALLTAMRQRRTRWFPLAGSAVVFATILAFVLATDYVTDYLAPFETGVLAVALLGIAVTLLAYLALQRYLGRRLPARRIRKRQCPFCAYPAGDNVRCEGCGREIVAPCASCARPRRVGTPHCGACGATSGAPARVRAA